MGIDAISTIVTAAIAVPRVSTISVAVSIRVVVVKRRIVVRRIPVPWIPIVIKRIVNGVRRIPRPVVPAVIIAVTAPWTVEPVEIAPVATWRIVRIVFVFVIVTFYNGTIVILFNLHIRGLAIVFVVIVIIGCSQLRIAA